MLNSSRMLSYTTIQIHTATEKNEDYYGKTRIHIRSFCKCYNHARKIGLNIITRPYSAIWGTWD